MADRGHELTDEMLKSLEAKITEEYRQASREVRDKLNDYLQKYETKDRIKQDQVRRGVISKEDYQKWRKGQIMGEQRWQALRDELAQNYVDANTVAGNMIRNYLPAVYAENFNFSFYMIEHDAAINTGFTLYDVPTIKRLLTDDPELLPPPGKRTARRIAQGLDHRWNRRQIQSVMMQSILQGESIPNIATRLAREVGDNNRKAAIRNARTMTTGAENAGRVDGFKRAEKMGIEMEQAWVATLDMRTRHEHRELDGVTVPVGEPWVTSDGDKIRFPGDPEAEPRLTYNCRCTVIAQIKGYEKDTTALRNDPDIGGMSYEDWKKDRREKSNPIDLPEKKAQAIRMQYIAGYKR